MKRLTTEEFIEKAKAVHGDRYDYSQVEYVNSGTAVTIVCPDHGPFPQTPDKHLIKRGCPDCGRANQRRNQLTTEQFIAKARAVHGDRYDYSQVEYVSNKKPVTIICPDHGPFEQSPAKHLFKSGCPDCGGTKQLTTETFIEKARAVHGDRYDYSQVEYVSNKKPVTIICPDHGPFEQAPADHLSKRGCLVCGKLATRIALRLTTEEFVEKAIAVHGDRYDYSQVDYVNAHTKVTINCPDHSSFPQEPSNHLSGQGCPECGGNKQLTTETFIEDARAVHGDRYDYSQVEYVKALTKVTIICPDHGPFEATPNNHLRERGCPDCADYGFNPNDRATLYYLAIETEDGDTRYKIGITNRTVEERFRPPDLARIRIVKTWQFAAGRAAAEREAEILRQYDGERYYGADLLVGAGNTELFTYDILGLDRPNEEDI